MRKIGVVVVITQSSMARFQRSLDALLPVLARCAWCNGGMYVRLRTRSWGRIPFYACTSHFTRGESVCRNFHLAPMDQVDDKVLECIGQILTLDPATMEYRPKQAVRLLVRWLPARGAAVRPTLEQIAASDKEPKVREEARRAVDQRTL